MGVTEDVSEFQAGYGAGNPSPGTAIRKVRRGDRLQIPAEAYNGLVDVLQARAPAPPRRATDVQSDAGVVLVRNDSGAAVDRFSVLSLESPIIDPGDSEQDYKNACAFSGDTPATADAGRFVIVTEPLADGAIGRGILSGVTPVQVDVTDADHGWADVTDGDETQLTSGASGAAQILWKESGTGTKWATVRVGVPPAPFRFWIARAAANFAWVEEDSTSAEHPGEFRLDSTSGAENLVVVKSDTVLDGAALSDVILDIPHSSSSWTYGVTNGSPGPSNPPPVNAQWVLTWTVTPILEDFDPSAIDWTDVAALSTGTAATCTLIDIAGTLTVESNQAEPIDGVNGQISNDAAIAGWLALKATDIADWSSYGTIYGFKIRIATGGESGQVAIWTGAPASARCYALPDN